jgi:hypothetical protein
MELICHITYDKVESRIIVWKWIKHSVNSTLVLSFDVDGVFLPLGLFLPLVSLPKFICRMSYEYRHPGLSYLEYGELLFRGGLLLGSRLSFGTFTLCGGFDRG